MAELPDREEFTGKVVLLGIIGRVLIAAALSEGGRQAVAIFIGLWLLQGAVAQVIAYHANRVIAHVHLAKEHGNG